MMPGKVIMKISDVQCGKQYGREPLGEKEKKLTDKGFKQRQLHSYFPDIMENR